MEQDTKITSLRNKMSPISNYFELMKERHRILDDKSSKLSDLATIDKYLKREEYNCLNVIDEVVETIKEIPNDAIK